MKKIMYPVLGFLMLFIAGCGESENSSFTKETTTIADFVNFYEKETGAKLTTSTKLAGMIGAVEGFGIENENGDNIEIYRYEKEPTEKNYPMIAMMKEQDSTIVIKGFFLFYGLESPLPGLDSVMENF